MANGNLLSISGTRTWMSIIYTVGSLGMLFFPEIFIPLTPFTLILSIGLLAYYDSNTKAPLILWWIAVGFLGWCIEWVGVHTGFPFGRYYYGNALGFKIDHIPVIIGINWMMLTYAFSTSIGQTFSSWPNGIKAAMVAIGMTLMDRLIESVCDYRDLWYWTGYATQHSPPIQNYISWFLVAWVFAFAFFTLRFKTKNSFSLFLIVLQFLFFVSLWIGRYVLHLS
ncbi:MAG: carotenoid biosynthesis protein [Cytophagaceae bacterium]|jgi:putative membrane protein|nr:carotenoid biosynthesis protein [Cytophagaceae bacterium]